MNLQVTVSFDEAALAAISTLAAAIGAVSGAAAKSPTPVATQTVSRVKAAAAETASAADEEEEAADVPVTVYWADNTTGEMGEVESEAEYLKLKRKVKGAYKVPAEKYEKMVAAAAKLASDDAAAAKAKAKAKPAAKEVNTRDVDLTVEDLVAAFSAYLPKDLDKAERADRHAFVKPMLARFGAAKVSEMDAEHFALAINLVQRKMAGEEIDPETEEFVEIDGVI